MNAVQTLIKLPPKARKGEVIEISALIRHPMESGFRVGEDGRRVPRNILLRFRCEYDSEQVFAAEFTPAIAANPIVVFCTVATQSGTLKFTWEGDQGFVHSVNVPLQVA